MKLFIFLISAVLASHGAVNFGNNKDQRSIVSNLPDNKGIIIEFPGVEKKELDRKELYPQVPGTDLNFDILMDKWEQTLGSKSDKKDKNDYKILKSFGDSNVEFLSEDMRNGLMGAMYAAYNQHVPLVLRPDDLWLSILSTFNLYVLHNSEKMRSIFVDHKGQKELIVSLSNQMQIDNISSQELSDFVKNVALQIKENTKGNIYNWIIPNFSTTTAKDRIIAEISLMSSMSDYFTYGGMMACGISQIQLEGTLEDWKLLKTKASMLRNFDSRLAKWSEVLGYVLDQFISARQGKADYNFWQTIISQDPRGSGGGKNTRGWFMVFSPFSVDAKQYYLNSLNEIKKTGAYVSANTPPVMGNGGNTIAATVVSAKVKLISGAGNPIGELLFVGGLNNPVYDLSKKSIRPSANWAVAIKK